MLPTTAQVFQFYRDDTSSIQQQQQQQPNNDYYYDDTEDSCEYCKRKTQRVTFKEFCKSNYVVLVNLLDTRADSNSELYKPPISNAVKFNINIDTVYKSSITSDENTNNNNNINKQSTYNRYYEIINYKQNSPNNNNKNRFFQEDDKTLLWVDNKDLLCSCPKLKLNRKYVIMAKTNTLVKPQVSETSFELDSYTNQTRITAVNDQSQPSGILLDRDTFITEWKPELVKRLRRFLKHYQNGKC